MLGSVIRRIRNNLSATQSALAQSLRVDQTAVSQYERNQIAPSTDVLIRLWSLADTADRKVIQDVLADRILTISSAEFKDLLDVLMRSPEARAHQDLVGPVLDRVKLDLYKREVFMGAVNKLLDSRVDIDLALSAIIELYQQHGHSPEISTLFQKALGYLEVEIREPAGLTPSARRRERKRGKQQI